MNPYELHTAFKAIAGLLDAGDLRIALTLPVATRVDSPATANSGYQVHDLDLRGRLVNDSFLLKTTVTTDVTTLCPCSKAISDYGAHNQRSRVSLTVHGEDDVPYPVPASDLVQMIRDSASCPVFRWSSDPMNAPSRWQPTTIPSSSRTSSATSRSVAANAGLPHQIEARNIESIHSHDAVARLSWAPVGDQW